MAKQLFMKFCVLEYRPWRCLAEVCSPSSSLFPSISANETLHSGSSLALIKTLHHHHPPQTKPQKHHHRFYNIFQPIILISGVRLWLYQECLRALITAGLVVYNWKILFHVKAELDGVWLCSEGNSFQQAAESEEFGLVIWKKMRCFQWSGWEN